MVNIQASINEKRYETTILSGNHQITADEPVSIGGEDLGFSPDELLAASLSACTAITLRMYANRKGWTHITGFKVDVKFERLNGSSRFERVIKIEGSPSEEEKERLLTIANKCPVHQTLTQPASIDTEIS